MICLNIDHISKSVYAVYKLSLDAIFSPNPPRKKIVNRLPCSHDCGFLYMVVSISGWYPKMDGLEGKIPQNWMIWGYPSVWKPPYTPFGTCISLCRIRKLGLIHFRDDAYEIYELWEMIEMQDGGMKMQQTIIGLGAAWSIPIGQRSSGWIGTCSHVFRFSNLPYTLNGEPSSFYTFLGKWILRKKGS